MNPDSWQQVRRIIDGSLEQSPEALPAWLDDVCGDNAQLRSRVEKLLSYEDRLDAFESAAPIRRLPPDERSAIDRQIGPYRIRELLARGGMGAVYRAERSEGFHQTVALKLMRPGIESSQALDRFHREREILAGLEHPNIARLLDGATGDDGRPYFVMELIDGEPIDRYCDQQRLSVRERAELLLPVCDALQFAHRNLIIHRDLKPGNILVDRSGTPKLLDFGIAKLMESGEAAAKISGQVMTPRYASPEQILEQSISTASDVYSLGVVLYRLLTGRLPCDLDSCSTGRVLFAVCEEQPQPPSEVVMEVVSPPKGGQAAGVFVGRPLSGISEGGQIVGVPEGSQVPGGWQTGRAPEGVRVVSPPEGGPMAGAPEDDLTPEAVAAARASTPRGLGHQLRGDLDAIVLKALRKEPERRYVSTERFAADLQRYLDGHPVTARRGTFGYRVSKYARRYRWQLGMAAVMAVMIFGFTVLLVLQLGRTEAERDRAERERDRAEHVSAFLVDLFRAAEPDRVSVEPSVRSLVDVGRQRLVHELEDLPEVRADLLNTLGQVYDRLGHVAAAGDTLDASLEILRRIHPGDHADVARALNDLAVQAYRWGDYPRSERYSRECIGMRQRLGLEDDLIKPRSNLAAVLRVRGQLDEATDLYRQGLAERRARWGDRHPKVAVSLSNVGITLYLGGDFDAAEPVLREALEIRRVAFEPGSAPVASVLGYLARLHHARGELDAADRLFLQALEIRRRRLGSDHLRVAVLEEDLAALLLERGDVDTAGVLIANALGTLYRLKPAGDPILAEAESVYGAYLAARGRREEAEVCLRSSLETLESVRGSDILPTRQARRRLEASSPVTRHEIGR